MKIGNRKPTFFAIGVALVLLFVLNERAPKSYKSWRSMGTIVTTQDGRMLLNPSPNEIRNAFPKWKPARKKKIQAPRIRPGYLNDLLKRMDSKKELPVPKGQDRTNHDTVRWQAYEEARRIDSLSILPQVSERLVCAKEIFEFIKLAKVLSGVIKNTKSKQACKLMDALVMHPAVSACLDAATKLTDFDALAELLAVTADETNRKNTEAMLSKLIQKLPNKPQFQKTVMYALSSTRSPAVRKFALAHFPDPNPRGCEWEVLEVLEANANPKDFPLLARALINRQVCASSLAQCVRALAACGGKRTLPEFRRFIEQNKKNRTWEYGYALEAAEMAIEELS